MDGKAAWVRRGCPRLYDVDAADEAGYTALMKAAANGHLGCVDHLIAKVRLTPPLTLTLTLTLSLS